MSADLLQRARTYYNEHEPFATAWLARLIEAGEIAGGCVDERGIEDVRPDDLAGYERAHFFAGIGGWDLALRLAGWPTGRSVWTGSCPCQPFSKAGKGEGFDDSRHLWPTWFRLIRECRPDTIFGEQVSSGAGLAWFDHVAADLEAEGYAVGALDTCAAGVGAPHIRQRLYWMADYTGPGWSSGWAEEQDGRASAEPRRLRNSSGFWMDDAAEPGLEGYRRPEGKDGGQGSIRGAAGCAAETGEPGPWSDAIWVPCRDGKARPWPPEPALFPLASGISNRVGTLRGAGNAICIPQAAAFVKAFLASREATA